ncbi:hypothetical protein ACWC5O_44895 [Streptomyces sp. NPDC001450]|uniref:hypothetical protein n=1 Tax=Streptomyces sp. NPDC005408 TaxID=3155341 RepID=UPI0033B893C5
MPGSRRSARQRQVSELHAQGLYGPTLRDVLPGFVGVGVAIGLPLAFLVWMYERLGVLGLVLSIAILVGLAVTLVRWRQAVARRRGGIYSAAQLSDLDEHGLAVAAQRFLRRDGWHVVSVPFKGRPRLSARDRTGRQLDVTFRPPGASAEGEPGRAPLREAGRQGVDRIIRVMVNPGSYSRTDVLWASRQGGVHLLDGVQLRQWAAGASLDDLGLPAG